MPLQKLSSVNIGERQSERPFCTIFNIIMICPCDIDNISDIKNETREGIRVWIFWTNLRIHGHAEDTMKSRCYINNLHWYPCGSKLNQIKDASETVSRNFALLQAIEFTNNLYKIRGTGNNYEQTTTTYHQVPGVGHVKKNTAGLNVFFK